MDSPQIDVAFLGKRPLSWWPDGTDLGASSTTDTLSAALEERQRSFLRVLERWLDDINDEVFSPERSAQKRRELWQAIVAVSDPAVARHLLANKPDIKLDDTGGPLDRWLHEHLLFVLHGHMTLVDDWTDRGGSGVRPAADKNAQSMVRSWYRNKCVLTCANKTEEAHIVPVRITQPRQLQRFWDTLALVWPVDRLADLAYKGREPTNILPLARGAHGRWDAYEFLLRPIPDTVHPETRIYLQMVWADEHTVGDCRGDGVLVEVSNGRRPLDDASYPPVQTGDVFCLETTDHFRCPLPSLEFLQIQHGVHRILGGLRAAATLTDIFRCGPPDDDMAGASATGDDLRSMDEDEDVPRIWQILLEAAVAKGIMDQHGAGRWARAFAQDTRRKRRFWAGEESDTGED